MTTTEEQKKNVTCSSKDPRAYATRSRYKTPAVPQRNIPKMTQLEYIIHKKKRKEKTFHRSSLVIQQRTRQGGKRKEWKHRTILFTLCDRGFVCTRYRKRKICISISAHYSYQYEDESNCKSKQHSDYSRGPSGCRCRCRVVIHSSQMYAYLKTYTLFLRTIDTGNAVVNQTLDVSIGLRVFSCFANSPQ